MWKPRNKWQLQTKGGCESSGGGSSSGEILFLSFNTVNPATGEIALNEDVSSDVNDFYNALTASKPVLGFIDGRPFTFVYEYSPRDIRFYLESVYRMGTAQVGQETSILHFDPVTRAITNEFYDQIILHDG